MRKFMLACSLWVAGLTTVLPFSAAPSALAEDVVRDLRIRAEGSQTLLLSPARLVGTIAAVELSFEVKGGAAESLRLAVRAPGGLVVLSQEVPIGSGAWQPHTAILRGERVCTAVTEGMRDTWIGLRADADRLANARAGHQEYLSQVQSRAVTLRSQQAVLERFTWTGSVKATLGELSAHLAAMEATLDEARRLDPSEVDAIKALAQQMVARAELAIPVTRRQATPETCVPGTSLPPSGAGSYDITLSQGGFPALSGEFRIEASQGIYLPALSRP